MDPKMNETWRKATAAAVAALACASGALQAQAQTTVIVPAPPGGSADVMARIVTQKISEATREVFIIDNRPGANGVIGAKVAAKARPDGKTWLFGDGALMTVNPFLYPKDANFDPDRDLKIVRALSLQPSLLVVTPGTPVRSVKDFIDYAKKHDITYASGGIGSAGHLTMEYFGSLAGLKFTHIPYKGGPATMSGLLGGEVPAAFIILPNALTYVKSDKLIPLAVSSPQRNSQLPNVPTMIEAGFPGFEVETAYFAMLPAGAPPDIVKQVDEMVLQAMSDPTVQARIRTSGLEPTTKMGSAESMKWIDADRSKWQKLIKDKGIKAE